MRDYQLMGLQWMMYKEGHIKLKNLYKKGIELINRA